MSRSPAPPDIQTARLRVSEWIAAAVALANRGQRQETKRLLHRKAAALKSLPLHQMPPAWAFHGQALIETIQQVAGEL